MKWRYFDSYPAECSLYVRMRRASAAAGTTNMNAAGPMPLISSARRCDTVAHKGDDEADARRHTEERPPDTKNQGGLVGPHFSHSQSLCRGLGAGSPATQGTALRYS